jgi:preprotein translocase subunit SecA
VLEGEAPGVLVERRAARWAELAALHGADLLHAVERRLTLVAVDHCWSEHLAEMQALRDEIHLVRLDGRDPLTEFYRAAGTAFSTLRGRIDDAVAGTFERITITAEGVDWEGEGLRGPSSTWTYMIDDEAFAAGTFQTLAHRASLGLWAVVLTWPLLFVWGLAERWRRRRR